jgi:hypothetical protein
MIMASRTTATRQKQTAHNSKKQTKTEQKTDRNKEAASPRRLER